MGTVENPDGVHPSTATALIPSPRLSPKALRTIDYQLRNVLGPRGSHSHAEAVAEPRRVLHPTITRNGETRYLTLASMDALVVVGQQIFESLRRNRSIADGDMWDAVVEEVQAQASDPRDTSRFVEGVVDRVRGRIAPYSYVADFEGIDLPDLESVPLGRVQIAQRDERLLDAFGPRFSEEKRRAFLRKRVWLRAQYMGTPEATKDLFAVDAIMTAGIVGIAACIQVEGGFSAVKPTVHINGRDSDVPARVLRWKGQWGSSDGWGILGGAGRGQSLAFTKSVLDYLRDSCELELLAAISQAQERNELEECIARAIFWFACAQRDSEPATAMLTLWSVVEVFYSTSTEDIAESLSDGLSKLLAFGPVKLVAPSEVKQAKLLVKRLYDQRCKAAHRAEHRHVMPSDLDHLGHWAAWCVICFAKAVADGYSTIEAARADIERIASKHSCGPSSP